MKVKVFEVSIDEKRSYSDEKKLNSFLEKVNVKKTSTQFITGAFNCWSVMVFYEEVLIQESRKSLAQSDSPDVSENVSKTELNEEEKNLLEKLKQWRQIKASSSALPVFMICRNVELEQMALNKPSNLKELKTIKGFGNQKVSKYGKELLKLIAIQKGRG